jgi:Holliday junction DNA helicase RuvA
VIAQIAGRLLTKELDRVEVMTMGGIGYELAIPLSVYETLPKTGDDVVLHTHLVVREDGWLLFGFANAAERRVFQTLLTANGVGPSLALGLLKKAERLVLDLADKLDDLPTAAPGGVRPEGAGADDAIRALVSLGYTTADAEKAVRGALDAGGRGMAAAELIRGALARLGGR